MIQYSPDRKWWWDGQQWHPVPPEQNRMLLWIVFGSLAVILVVGVVIGVVILAAVGGGSTSSQPSTSSRLHNAPEIANVTFTKSAIQFDYFPKENCATEKFFFTFLDSSGKTIDTADGTETHAVKTRERYHFTIETDYSMQNRIPAGTAEVIVTPRCT